MTKLFKLASILYRLLLGLLLLFSIVASFVVGAAGHSAKATAGDYLFYALTVSTIVLLTLYQSIEKSTSGGRVLHYLLIVLFFAAIGFEIYSVYETYFICKCFTTGDHITSLLIFLFGILTAIVLTGLIKDKL